MHQLSYFFLFHLFRCRFHFGGLGLVEGSFQIFFSSFLLKLTTKFLGCTFFSIFILKTCRALKRWGQIRVLLRGFSLLFISGSSLLYLLGVQEIRCCFWSWVWDYLVLLIGWIIYLIPVNNISLFLSALLLLFILFTGLINDPHPILNPHSSNFNSTNKLTFPQKQLTLCYCCCSCYCSEYYPPCFRHLHPWNCSFGSFVACMRTCWLFVSLMRRLEGFC